MSINYNRNLQDKNFVSTVTLLAAGANTASFDLEQVEGGDITNVVFELAGPALTTAQLADTKVVTYKLEDSADGSSFATVDPLIQTTQTGAGGAGAAAKTIRFRLPANTRRYVRIAQTATATPGTLTASMVAKLLF
ncbi:hypothetical protein UFOVP612_21 [uncultured Caudovirales phage]|uniref:Uncharacterized protein n=1 Tax=uncultured Caudovirales phage TaxID=2100421 RepID=A0A6J5N1V5_9CAUD|nr:hypothetical protein UFOVP612_21 [uncultured Caudovirales phage]